jgi:hypothetical protein
MRQMIYRNLVILHRFMTVNILNLLRHKVTHLNGLTSLSGVLLLPAPFSVSSPLKLDSYSLSV